MNWFLKNLLLQLSLGWEEWLVLENGGKRDNRLNDSNNFERMDMSTNSEIWCLHSDIIMK